MTQQGNFTLIRIHMASKQVFRYGSRALLPCNTRPPKDTANRWQQPFVAPCRKRHSSGRNRIFRGKNQLASYAWGSDDFKTAAFRIGSLFALVVCPTVNGHWDRLGGMICKWGVFSHRQKDVGAFWRWEIRKNGGIVEIILKFIRKINSNKENTIKNFENFWLGIWKSRENNTEKGGNFARIS